MKTRAAFGSMGSMKMDGSGSSDLLLGSSRSRTGRYISPLAISIVHIWTNFFIYLRIHFVTLLSHRYFDRWLHDGLHGGSEEGRQVLTKITMMSVIGILRPIVRSEAKA